MENKIAKRCDIPVEFTWRLEDIFESDEIWQSEYDLLKKDCTKIASFAGRLKEGSSVLLDFFKLMDEMENRIGRIYGYAFMKYDQDTSDGKYQALKGKGMSLYVLYSQSVSFFTPELLKIDDETISNYYKETPALEEYRRLIEVARRRKAHILSESEESLLAMSHEVSETAHNVYSSLLDADMKWDNVTDGEGKSFPLTNGSFVPLLESPDVNFRKTVFEAYYNHLSEYINTLSSSINGQFKGLTFNANARKYGSTLEAALDVTEVPVNVYINLIDTIHKNFEPMYKYVSLRKKLLGLDELHMYDVYTPIITDCNKKISFEQAKETVIEALGVLGEDYINLLKEGFNNRWIDVYENEGKRSGAYSAGSKLPHPFVLLNHKDNLDSMFTLAHEMGHALHSYHSSKYQPESKSDYVIFVAEVASTCNEVLLIKHLLKKCTDKAERAYLINHFLDSFKGTVYRQTMFAEFELFMGRASEKGEVLTSDMLCNKYLELNKMYFGPDMISDDLIKYEWARIPHFYLNYYVFQYATGFSAAVAIANRILTEGESAVKDYKAFLSGGCSTDPVSLLKIAGIDMGSPKPIESALEYFKTLVDEFESLT